jgi:hypothetical protein
LADLSSPRHVALRTSGSGTVPSRCLFYCFAVEASSGEWVQVIAYANGPRTPRPADALTAWLRDLGIDWMPFADDDIRIDLACGKTPDGRPQGWYSIKVRSGELRRIGLHPDQFHGQ